MNHQQQIEQLTKLQVYQALREEIYTIRNQFLDEEVITKIEPQYKSRINILKSKSDGMWYASAIGHISNLPEIGIFYHEIEALKKEAKRRWPSPSRPSL